MCVPAYSATCHSCPSFSLFFFSLSFCFSSYPLVLLSPSRPGQLYGTYGGEILITDEREQTFLYTFKASGAIAQSLVLCPFGFWHLPSCIHTSRAVLHGRASCREDHGAKDAWCTVYQASTPSYLTDIRNFDRQDWLLDSAQRE